jgi:hypothetical protein
MSQLSQSFLASDETIFRSQNSQKKTWVNINILIFLKKSKFLDEILLLSRSAQL